MSTKVTGRVTSLSYEELSKIESHNSKLASLFNDSETFDNDITSAIGHLIQIKDFVESAPHCTYKF